jgi:hypothetical protein
MQLKALTKVSEIEWAQVLNGHERGLLINFEPRVWSVGALFGPTTVRKESETKSA